MLQVGQNIRRIREYKNLTQEWVADKAGMSVSAYGNIERGDTDLNFRKLADIAEALDVKEEDIVTYGSTVYQNTFHNSDNTVVSGQQGATHINTNNVYTIEKHVFDKMMKDKDEEIAFLRGLVGKG